MLSICRARKKADAQRCYLTPRGRSESDDREYLRNARDEATVSNLSSLGHSQQSRSQIVFQNLIYGLRDSLRNRVGLVTFQKV